MPDRADGEDSAQGWAEPGDEDESHRLDLRVGLVASLLGLVIVGLVSAYGLANTEAGQQVPVHFGPGGEADRLGSRWEAFGVMPLILLAVTGLLAVLPRIDPRRLGVVKSLKAYNLMWAATVALLVGVHVMATRAAVTGSGGAIDERFIVAGIGVLFCIIGNYLPKTGSNWFFGIRTPWTLSDERVWTATHRVGGRVFMAIGVLAIAAAFLLPAAATIGLVVAMAVITAVGSFAYSYLVYRRLNPSG